MEDKKQPESFNEIHAPVPFYAHEAEVVRLERNNKRVWILCIIIFLALILTNAGWIYYENQFADEQTTITQEVDDGYNNYIGNDGDIINGESTADSNG